MNDRMFAALAHHERHLVEYIQSKNRNGASPMSTGQQRSQPMYQGIMPHGINVQPNGNDADLYDAKSLVIDQPMEFPPLDVPLDLIEKASEVEPIPFEELNLSGSSSSGMFSPGNGNTITEAMYAARNGLGVESEWHNNQQQQSAFTHSSGVNPRYATYNGNANMDPRHSISALSIDWETFEMLDRAGGGDGMDEAGAMRGQQHHHHHHSATHDLPGAFHPIAQVAGASDGPLQGLAAYQV
jgi:hypothetical protein